MGLYVHMVIGLKDLLVELAAILLKSVIIHATAIIAAFIACRALSRIAFRVLVRQAGTESRDDILRDEILRRNQLNGILLADFLLIHQ